MDPLTKTLRETLIWPLDFYFIGHTDLVRCRWCYQHTQLSVPAITTQTQAIAALHEEWWGICASHLLGVAR